MENYSHRLMLGCSATALLLAVGGAAYAQDATETVIVSSTRLTNAGFDAPTPTTVVGAADIEKNAQPSVFETISQLPALQGSVGASGETGSTTTGLQGLSTLGLRGLSPLRTLVLFDGQRVVGGNFNGAVDVSQIPQMLIKRVDVVTGGASASWGSDAVAGVINFVTDTRFEGFKANMMGGITTYGDDANSLFQFAAGRSFMGGRLHVEVSGEYEFTAGVQPQLPVSGQFSALPNYGGRRFDSLQGTASYTLSTSSSTAPAGYPSTIYAPITQGIQTAAYGLVTSGPKQGNAFGANGAAQPFQYAGGNTGAPGGCYLTGSTLNGVVANTCFGTPAVPGDLTDTKQGTHGLIAPLQRGDFYTRISYDLTPDTNIYFTLNEGQVRSMNVPAQGNSNRAGLKIGCDNAYLPSTGLFGVGLSQAATQAACNTAYPAASGYIFQYPYLVVYPNATATSAGAQAFASPYPAKSPPVGYAALSTATPTPPANAYPFGAFGFGTDSANINQVQKVFLQRDQRRYVVGGDGAFSIFGTDWTWSSYAEHGETDTGIHITNMPLSNRYNLAMDAIQDPTTGNIVCRDPTARANGCVPYNPFGNVPISAASLAYIDNLTVDPKAGPWAIFTQRQEAFSFSVNGAPIEDWAGKIAVAAGIEYREEEFTSRADPYSSGVTASTPASLIEPCTDPSINCGAGFPGADSSAAAGNAWNAGNYHDGSGSYHVSEAFLEFGIPLLNDEAFGKLDLDIAGRVEAYSTAGQANTWKVGLTWDTPLPGVRLRALQSRDVRAPNLSELYQPPQGLNGSFNNDFITGTPNQTTRQLNIGNTLLAPEVGATTQVGVVYQPEWLPGFQASVDYWRITVRGEIASLTTQQVEDQCYNGVYCGQDAIITANGVNQGPGNTGALGLPGAVTGIASKVFNLAGAVEEGMDIEAAWAFDLQNWDIPGNFVVRTLATDTMKYIINPGIVGQATNVEIAGVLGGGFNSATYNASGGNALTWKLDNTQSYDAGDWGVSLTERWLAGGQFQNKNFILCNIGSCPVATIQHPTTNYDAVDAAFYLDIGGHYKVSEKTDLYFKIDNLANLPPPLTGSQEPNNLVYDILGRMYRIGVRFND